MTARRERSDRAYFNKWRRVWNLHYKAKDEKHHHWAEISSGTFIFCIAPITMALTGDDDASNCTCTRLLRKRSDVLWWQQTQEWPS